MPNSKTKRCQTLKSKSAYMQQALFREAEFSVFRGDLPAVLSGIICVTLSATQILHVTETSNIDDLVTQNIIALRYPSCILDVTQCAAYLRIYYSAAILLLSQPLSRFASGVPCHAPTLPHRETVMRQDIISALAACWAANDLFLHMVDEANARERPEQPLRDFSLMLPLSLYTEKAGATEQ